MHSGPTLLLVLFCAIALIVFLIVKVRVHAFLALTAVHGGWSGRRFYC